MPSILPTRQGVFWRGQHWKIKDACAESGIKRRTYEERRARGWTVTQALDTPLGVQRMGKQPLSEEARRKRAVSRTGKWRLSVRLDRLAKAAAKIAQDVREIRRRIEATEVSGYTRDPEA